MSEAIDAATVKLLAELAGLQIALAQFPDDVAAAAVQATNHRPVIRFPAEPAAEPWPPMQASRSR
jgi:hypothetical protein